MVEKVLIVDDEIDLLRLLAYILRAEDFKVVEAATGADALKKVISDKPDVILLDVMLPDMSGIDVCKKVREMFPSSRVPIIMLSARVQASDKAAGIEAGADEYVTKPFDMEDLVTRIREHLKQGHHRK
jgi:DNA-binding response OmpR family regulator